MRQITFPPTFAGWRQAARQALQEGVEPGRVIWQELSALEPPLPMFEEENREAAAPSPVIRVPKEFFPLAQKVACHADARRWALLYQALFRLTHGEPHLLELVTDPTMHELKRMEKAIRHEVHKMRAFVRFRAVQHEGATWYVAWFEPAYPIVELNAPFFRDRFASMHWSILTPDRCVHWDGQHLSFTEGVPKSEAPTEDQVEGLWLQYYSSIFNPARVKTHAMQAEMPKRYWKNLPETAVIPALLQSAPVRTADMVQRSHARPIRTEEKAPPSMVPASADLPTLRQAAHSCQACPLHAHATQTVFGEGPEDAELVLVGEQPGDQEDKEGHPFVGPAGQLLDRALEEAGLDRSTAYVTNAVKHFKWERRGQRRIHAKPAMAEVKACRPWLEAELHQLRPRVLLLLGSTAAHSVLGPSVRVLRDRGQVFPSEFCPQTVVTVHPSSLLRAPDEAARESGYAAFVNDLRLVRELLQPR